MIEQRTSGRHATAKMSDFLKLPLGIRQRRRTADEWDKTIIAFQSPYRLKDLCVNDEPGVSQASDAVVGGKQEFKVRLANTDDRRKSASLLIQKMYSWRGYDSPDLKGDPSKITLAAFQDDRVIGTLTLGLDSPQGLVVDQLYKAEADKLRAEGRNLCDVTKLAVDQEIKSKSVLGALFHLSVIYGRNIHHATDFLIEVNPRHAPFYQRMIGFMPWGEERMCPRVSAPAVLLRLDLDHVDEQVKLYGGLGAEAHGVKNIFPYWFSKADELGITQRLLNGD